MLYAENSFLTGTVLAEEEWEEFTRDKLVKFIDEVVVTNKVSL